MSRNYEGDYTRRDASRRDRGEDRHGRDRPEARERPRVAEESRGIPRDRIDPIQVVDARMSASRGLADPRGANAAARLEPRADRHGSTPVDTRTSGEPTYYEDPRTGRLVEMRAEQQPREIASRYHNSRDDRMDTDMDAQPRRQATREVVESRDHPMEEAQRSNKYNDYFVPGTGM